MLQDLPGKLLMLTTEFSGGAEQEGNCTWRILCGLPSNKILALNWVKSNPVQVGHLRI